MLPIAIFSLRFGLRSPLEGIWFTGVGDVAGGVFREVFLKIPKSNAKAQAPICEKLPDAERVTMNGGKMNHEMAVSAAREIADHVLAPAASQNDKQGRFSVEAVEALGKAGLLGLMLPIKFGGGNLGPRTFAGVTST